jgi:hypothetical protein
VSEYVDVARSILYVNGAPVCLFTSFEELERFWLACCEDAAPGHHKVAPGYQGGLLDLDEVVSIRFRGPDTADVEIETHV